MSKTSPERVLKDGVGAHLGSWKHSVNDDSLTLFSGGLSFLGMNPGETKMSFRSLSIYGGPVFFCLLWPSECRKNTARRQNWRAFWHVR